MKRPEHFVTCGQMKLLEQRADAAGLSYYQMMENAGSRAAEFILSKASFVGMAEEDGEGMSYVSGKGWTEISAEAAENPAGNYVAEDTFTKASSGEDTSKIVEIPNKSTNDDDKTDAAAADTAAAAADTGAMRDVSLSAVTTAALNSAGNIAYVFCGKGNNGGDGFVVARILSNAGWNVTVILVDGEPKTDDSIINFGLLEPLPVKVLDMTADNRALMKLKMTPDLIVDAIYGTGFKGKLKGNGLKAAIYINKMGSLAKSNTENAVGTDADIKDKTTKAGTLIFALDIPSGLGGDLTRQRELDNAAVCADYTVTFHAKKPVHLKSFAAEYCGEIVIADIGINEKEMMHVEIYDEE